MAAIVTRCLPDCSGSLFRGVFSDWEAMEPPGAFRRRGHLPRVVLGKDMSGLIAPDDRATKPGAPRPATVVAVHQLSPGRLRA